QRYVQLAPLGRAASRLVFASRAGIQHATVLVDIREYEVGVFLVGVEDTVAMMHVDVDVADAAQAVLRSQRLDRDAAVAEYAESARVIARGMMQSTDRLERAGAFLAHDAGHAQEGRAGHARRCTEHAGENRRVAVVEELDPVALRVLHLVDVGLRM